MKKAVHLAALLGATLMMPALSSADSFTFSISGNPLQVPVTSFSFGVSGGSGAGGIGVGTHRRSDVSLVTPLPDPLGSVLSTDLHGGTGIASMTLDVYKDISGVSTLIESLEFDKDLVVSLAISTNGNTPSEDVTFAYESVKLTVPGGGTGPVSPPPAPEPATLILLGGGVAALCALRKKRLA